MINPIPEEQKEINLTEDSSIEHQDQQSNESIPTENAFVDHEMSTTIAPSSSILIDKTEGSFY